MRFGPWTLAYLASVPFVNFLWATVPPIQTPFGIVGVGAIVVGGILVVRDFANREVGNWILLATLVGIGFSYVLADPRVATASACAFAASELADFLVFTFTRRPFRDRVVVSQLVGAPIDSVVFLLGIGQMSAASFAVMTASKLAVLVFFVFRRPAAEEVAP